MPSWLKFNLLLETVDLDDKIGHLFVVDIEFDEKRATEWEYMYKEILTPIIKKQKILEANERSFYHLLDLFCKTSDNKPTSYHYTAKISCNCISKKNYSALFRDFKISDNEKLL